MAFALGLRTITGRTDANDMTREPIIGVTKDASGPPDSSTVRPDFYASSVEKAGGKPLPIYYTDNLSAIPAILDSLDGLLFSGGDDLDPALYGQPWHPMAKPVNPIRQSFELALLTEAERRRLPILGICLGCQLLNVYRGGSLIQFLPDSPRPGPLEHRKIGDVVLRHDVAIEPASTLGQTIGKPVINVNTYHKQAIDRIGRDLHVIARAPDGVIEGIEDITMPLFVGVQWHPERISDEPEHHAIFRLLVDRASNW